MLPNPQFGSLAPRPTVSGTSAATRVCPFERAVQPEHVAAARATPFSRVAEEQRATSAAIDAFVEQLPVGVLLVDRDACVVYANEAARALRVERLEPLQWAIMRALLTEDAVRDDEIQVAAPGEPRCWLRAHVMPVRVAGLGVNGAFVTVSDMTASHQMNAWNPVIETLGNL